MRRILVIWLFTLAMVAMVSPAQANLILNGSFEDGTAPGVFTTVFSGETTITDWTVGGDSVDYIGTYWTAQNLSRSIDLAGNGPGSISQTFNTVNNQTYHVEFYMAGNPDGGGGLRTLLVSAGATSDLPFSFPGGGSRTNMNWVLESFDFIGTGSPTTLIFVSDMTGPYGAALDTVSVNAVPEPGTLILLGSGLLGLAIAGARKKFRK